MQSGPDDFGVVVAERSFVLFEVSGNAVQVTARVGMPVGVRGEYRCPIQLIGVGDERVHAPYGEDPFVALQYGIDLIGQLLDKVVSQRGLVNRFQHSNPDRSAWIWRYPPD